MALEGLHHITASRPAHRATSTSTPAAATLGSELKPPARYESRREQLERVLTPVENPRAAA